MGRAARASRIAPLRTEARRWHERILRDAAAGGLVHAAPSDRLYKDVAAAFGRGAPVEAWIVTRCAPFGGRAARGLPSLLRRWFGGREWLTVSYSPAEKSRANAHGFHRVLATVGELLRADPELSGFYLAPNWLNDPAVGGRWPHLGYRTELMRASGGRSWFSHHEGAESRALSGSAERRAAFASGDYRPAAHGMLWRRAPLIQWASNPMCDTIPPLGPEAAPLPV